jgi:acyl-coenzyme A synthetase/AMP-(fatty) acid ligase
MKLLRCALLVLSLAGLVSVAQGQLFAMGRVINGTTDEPIPGLSVYLIDDAGQRLPAEDDELNVTDQDGVFIVSDVALETWYTVEVYSGKALRFTDYVFVEDTGEDIEEDTVTLPDFIVDY